MAVGGIDHDHVHVGADQRRHTLFGIAAGTDRRAGPQASPPILASMWKIAGFLNILDRDHPSQLKAVVDYQYLFDAVLVQQLDNFLANR